MIEEEAMWYELECVDSQQASSSKGALLTTVPSARALSQTGARPSGCQIEEVNSEETEVVYSKEALLMSRLRYPRAVGASSPL